MRAEGPVPTIGSVHHNSQCPSRLLYGASTGTGEPGACYSTRLYALANAQLNQREGVKVHLALSLLSCFAQFVHHAPSGLLPLTMVNQEPVTAALEFPHMQ